MRPIGLSILGRKLVPLLLILIAVASSSATVVSRLSASSRIALSRNSRHMSRMAPPMTDSCYQMFIAMDDMATVDLLRGQGIKIDGVFDGYVTARVPVNKLNRVTTLDGVKHTALARPLHLCNDSARFYSFVNPLHEAKEIIAPLKGNGVIVGIVDCGIDFNHINLLDENGQSRVKAVYLPEDSLGNPPVIGNDTLPGSCYETPWEIAALTTDFTGSNHGTHTTGTAAGSYSGNGWYGVAPQANIVCCGMPANALSDVNVANAVKYIFNYADRVGKPCVINLSLGNNEGPNNGSSFLCQTFSSMSGPGRICVVSAGNDGNAPICFHHTIDGVGDTVTTLLRNQLGGPERQGYVSMWSDKDQVHQTRIVIVNRYTGQVEYSSPLLGLLPEDSVYYMTSDMDTDFAEFYTGEVWFANAVEPTLNDVGGESPDGRYHSIWEFDATAVSEEHLLGLQYLADGKTDLVGWSSNSAYFYTYDIPGVTGGSSSGSISDLATTDSVISVGAYCSRKTYFSHDGSLVSYRSLRVGDIASFSSYGPDENGIARPDICAPGAILLSSANRYDENSNRQKWPAPVDTGEDSFPYYANLGTSMSAPVVTGTIALMLQVNPKLSTSTVRNIFNRSAYRDSYVVDGQQDRWGSGKLDSKAAVNDVIQNTFIPGDVNNDGEVNILDVEAIIDIILGRIPHNDVSRLIRADVDHNHEIMINDVSYVINIILNY